MQQPDGTIQPLADFDAGVLRRIAKSNWLACSLNRLPAPSER